MSVGIRLDPHVIAVLLKIVQHIDKIIPIVRDQGAQLVCDAFQTAFTLPVINIGLDHKGKYPADQHCYHPEDGEHGNKFRDKTDFFG